MARKPSRPAFDGKVEVEGLPDLRKKLREAGIGYGDLKDAGREAADLVATTARGFVPVLSGRLAASIRPAGQAKGAVVRAGSAAVPYAGVIHFGWPARGIEPHPFLYEAADARVAEVEALYLARIEKISEGVSD